MILRPHSTRIGLALGGGAMLGAAHVGVLKALEEIELQVSAVAGTSIGALVSALYAFNVPAKDIEAVALRMEWGDVGALKFSKMGLFSNSKLGELVVGAIGDVNIEDAPKPLAIMATDLASGSAVILRKGSVAQAVMASACVPGVFVPVTIGEHVLVDGGLVENVPVSALNRAHYDCLMAVDLSTHRHYSPPEDVFDVMTNAIDIAIDNHTRGQLKQAHCLIQPDLTTVSRVRADAKDIQGMIDTGYKTAVATLKARTGWRGIWNGIRRRVTGKADMS